MRAARDAQALLLLLWGMATSCARTGFEPWPCEGVDCSGHGSCGVTLQGEPLCACDPGFRGRGALACERDPYGVISPDVDAAVLDGASADLAGRDGAASDRRRDAATPDGDAPRDAAIEDAAFFATGTWVHIPGGSFVMGCSEGDPDCYVNEEPRHAVTVTAFHMLETEVTQAMYLAVMGDNPSYFSADGAGADCGLACPVEQISWFQARQFCQRIGGRLPSEAEWEYAARAGTAPRFICGSDAACLSTMAWYWTPVGETTHPVGAKAPNDFGLYDVLGNVAEWVEDSWHLDYTGAPTTGEVWGDGDTDYRLLRGGSWFNDPSLLRISVRFRFTPASRRHDVGVRCAR